MVRLSQNRDGSSEFSDIRYPSFCSKDVRTATQDAYAWMSAETVSRKEDLDSTSSSHHGEGLPPSYPLPLVLFVCILSVIGGLVVTGVHYAILYSGCPLGLNGCNDFTPSKEKYGFFLIRAIGDGIPEDIVYICAAAVGGLVFAQMCVRLPEHLSFQILGGGTVQGLVAVASGQRISLTAAALRIVASCTYLGTGGTLGMDGPAIQVCTAVTTFCGWVLGMRGVQTQSLLASLGFAAGFAATFNAPLAGVMFAMEELAHASPNLSRHIICIILMVSIVATAVARLFSGNKELLQTQWSLELMSDVEGGSLSKVFGVHMWMLVSIPIAVVCSLFGHLASVVMRKTRVWMLRLQDRVSVTSLLVLAMVLSASIGSAVFRATGLRGVWGIGYESLQKVFDQEYSVANYFIFAAGKMLATAVAVAVRAPADLLEPVLIVGAFLGGGMGRILQAVAEDDLEQRIMQPCIVFGMVAFFASCFRFPLTPVLLVLEVAGVDTYALVLPAALASFTAVTMSNRLYVPFLDNIMEEDGISLHDLSENAASVEDGPDDEDHQPEPEDDRGSQAPSEQSLSSHSTHSSTKFRTVFRNMEASMLTLSSTPPKSRSSSRSNSWNHSVQSDRSQGGAAKLNALLGRIQKAESHASPSPSPSTHSIGNISLHMHVSESGRSKRNSRLNTGASSTSAVYNSENVPVPNAAVDHQGESPRNSPMDVTGIMPSVFGADVRPDSTPNLLKVFGSSQDPVSKPSKSGEEASIRRINSAHGPQTLPVAPLFIQEPSPDIQQHPCALYTRTELETMKTGMLIRTATSLGVPVHALDDAIEESHEAVIELILGKTANAGGQVASIAAKKAEEQPKSQKESSDDSSLTVCIGEDMVRVTADDGVCVGEVLEARLFKDWINTIAAQRRMSVSKIHLQCIDMLGPQVGCIQFQADATVDGRSVPGVVSLRSGSVAILLIFHCEGQQFTLVVRQPRVATALSSLAEIPAGSLDDDGNLSFAGAAGKRLREATSIETEGLIDMTSLAYKDEYAGICPTCASTNEFVRIFLYQKMVSAGELEKLNEQFSGAAEEGDTSSVKIVALHSLWRISPDANALAALTLYDRLKVAGLISNESDKIVNRNSEPPLDQETN